MRHLALVAGAGVVAMLALPALLRGAAELLDDSAGDDLAPDYGADQAGIVGQGLALVEELRLKVVRAFQLPASAAPYTDAIASAESANALPQGLLARLLYQESSYRPGVIDGSIRSSAGAIGIAQFMPATAAEMRIDPRDPYQSIDAAGRYLSQLFDRFGNWTEALGAYNWGMGNVGRRGMAQAPAETWRYVRAILGDVDLG